MVGGDHRDGVEAASQEQKFWLGRVRAAQGSSDIGSNVADGGSSGARGRENRAEVPVCDCPGPSMGLRTKTSLMCRKVGGRSPAIQKRPATLEHRGFQFCFDPLRAANLVK